MANNDEFLQQMLSDVEQQLIQMKTPQSSTSDSWKLYISRISVDFNTNPGRIYRVEFLSATSQDYIVNLYELGVNNWRFGISGISPSAGYENFNKFVVGTGASGASTIEYVSISTQPGQLKLNLL